MTKNMELIERLKEFIQNEMRSCSMDIGGITPVYVYRMWGGKYSIEEIEHGFTELRRQGFAEVNHLEERKLEVLCGHT